MGFPGTIVIGSINYINYVVDICMSLAEHGFKKILLVSSHGGNVQAMNTVIREVASRTDAILAGGNVLLPHHG